MMRIYATVDDRVQEIDTITPNTKGPWISLIGPTASEIGEVSIDTGVPLDFLRAPLDDEEKPRLEFENGQVLVIIDIPIHRPEAAVAYDTLPLGIIITDNCLITVCLEANEVLHHLLSSRPGSVYTTKRTRFLLQILYATATLYLRYLRQLDRKTDEVEAALRRSMKNEELFKLLEMAKSLVFFSTSLRSNQVVMERLLRSQLRKDPDPDTPRVLKMYPEDEDLLEDVIIENKQAIEMGDIYSSILSGMMDAFASVISNNLNIVMKLLASITIVMAIPTIVASFWGMNVSVPGQNSPIAFVLLLLLSLGLSGGAIWALAKRGMF